MLQHRCEPLRARGRSLWGVECGGAWSGALLSSQEPQYDSGTSHSGEWGFVEGFAWKCFQPYRKEDEWVT